MKTFFHSLLLMLLWAGTLAAQNSYTARIVDAESGEPLPLVSIYVSPENGTLTNFDGEFSIQAEPTDLLRITCVGRQSLALQAGELPAVIRMGLLTTSLPEVTVRAVEGTLLEIARRTEKAFQRRRNKEAQYFYRQTSVLAQKQDIVEAFIGARSAVNLRELQFLTGRHGLLSQAAWANSSINDMNLHHILELGPMTREASFWRSLIAPLPTKDLSVNRAPHGQGLGGIAYLQHFYDISIDEMDGDDQQLYRIQLQRREGTEVKQPIMTGTLYVDRPTLSVLAFDGQVENMSIRFGRGELRSATTVPAMLNFRIDYRYDHKYPEVADLSMQTSWGDFQTRTLLFNVEGQKRLRNKKGSHARENMLSSISRVGYDSTFWANNEVVKRTAEETAIAAGTVDRQQARLDSIAVAQAALPPLERLADRLSRFGQAIPQEKVYLHMDNTCYFLGDTIWFAAYTRRTNSDTPSRISRVLYCELWNHDGYLVERKLVEMKEGRGHGFFALPDTLYSGYFELRAYTRWQLNWGQTEHYHNWSTEYWFYNKAMAKDFFRDYEKLYSRVFPVYDKPKEAGDFYRDMTLRPLRRYFKTAPKPAELRLSLFPEGGNLVAGVPCRVAFEAATSEGEVKEGTLTLKTKNEEVISANTENRGRGTFIFTPEQGQDYEVVFTATDGQTARQAIKDVQPDGVALQAHQDSLSGRWNFTIHAAGQAAQQPLGVTVMHEGQVLYHSQLPIHDSHSSTLGSMMNDELSITNSDLSRGVNQITVFDSIGHVYADRLFFVTAPELAQPTLMLSGVKEQYQPYERVELDITSAHLMPEQTISLSVRDAALQDQTFDTGNIMTEMLLASEIKGFVPQPEYFFEADDQEHRRALDLLMLTQGWRRFNWQEMAVKGAWELTHPAEHTQMVTGTVNRYFAEEQALDPARNKVLEEHINFMTHQHIPLSEQSNFRSSDAQNEGALGGGFTGGQALYRDSPYGSNRRNGYAWDLRRKDPLDEDSYSFQATSTLAPFQTQRPEWMNDDYNVLAYRTTSDYRQKQRQYNLQAARRYLEEGNLPHEMLVHAEFVNPTDEKDYIVGEMSTQKGQFQIDLPRFQGEYYFFLGASDTLKTRNKAGRRQWVKLDPINEYNREPEYPEFYVRLNFPYPRWVKPYTFYQVHNAPLPGRTGAGASSATTSRLLTDGTNLLNEVTVRARHGGLRRIDYTKPAYVLDAYDALNLAMDAGLIDFSVNANKIATRAAMSLIGDMGMERHYELTSSFNSAPGRNYGYLDQIRHSLLTFTDKIYIYTDYSPRREGDERFEQDNQPSVRVDLRPYPNQEQRVTYVDRRYVIPGFAYQEDFYHPDYQRRPPTAETRDYRRTLYWNPELKLDAGGRAHVSLFTGSRAATLAIEAAGQTADGGLLYSR